MYTSEVSKLTVLTVVNLRELENIHTGLDHLLFIYLQIF